MDMTQLAQAVTWLQEEHNRDKQEIDRLSQRLDAFRRDNLEQANKIKDLEERLAKHNSQLVQSSNIDISLDKVRKEVSLALEKHERYIQKSEKDAIILRQTDREATSKAISELRREVQQVAQMESLSKVPFLEDLARRNERNIQQLQTLDAELRHQQNLSSEALQLAEVERDRQMVHWRNEIQAQKQLVEQFISQISGLQEQGQASKQLLQTLSQFEERLQKQQDHVAELQRLAEDRQKRELAEWQAENEKRWKKWETTFERQLSEYRQQAREITDRIEKIEKRLVQLVKQLTTLWRSQRSFAYHRVGEVQKWVTEFEDLWEEYENLTVDEDGFEASNHKP